MFHFLVLRNANGKNLQIGKNCFVISSDGFVVAGQDAQKHMSSTDPLLFASLIRKSIIKKSGFIIGHKSDTPTVLRLDL